MEESKGNERWSRSYSTFVGDGDSTPLIPFQTKERSDGKVILTRKPSALTTLSYMLLVVIFCMVGIETNNHYFKSAERGIMKTEELQATGKYELKSGLSPSKSLKSPHIVYILADDLGYGDATIDSPDLSGIAPNIHMLASQGIRLGSYYTQYMCTPTRAALLTGVYPFKTGMQHSSITTKAPWGLPLESKILPQYLKEAGYKTHMVGKWHLGFYKTDYLPANRGFDSFVGILSDQIDYYTHETEICLGNPTCFKDLSMQQEANGELIPLVRQADEELYSEAVYRNRVQDILSEAAQNKDEPLFLYVAHQLVHAPLEAPPKDELTEAQEAAIASIKDEIRKTNAKMTAYLDNSIGRLIGGLKEHGLYENSIIIVASDNGGCPNTGASNGDFRGHKATLYEGGVRVNALIHSPLFDEEIRGKIFDGLFHVTDWVPTLLEGVLGLNPTYKTEVDGMNQWDALSGQADSPRKELVVNIDSYDYIGRYGLIEAEYPKSAFIKNKMKLIVNENKNIGYHDAFNFGSGTTCSVVAAYEPSFQLYDLEKDPLESKNLVQENPMAVLHMLEEISEYKKSEAYPAYSAEVLYGLLSWSENNAFITPWE